jgi:hypothetical protein
MGRRGEFGDGRFLKCENLEMGEFENVEIWKWKNLKMWKW